MAERYAVFGHPIGHSKSPLIHTWFAQQTAQDLSYEAVDVPGEQFEKALAQFLAAGGRGLNCTVPLKELAFKRADRCSQRALSAKAVNTLRLEADGSLYGDNTDGIGLLRDLTVNLGLRLGDRRILLLGAGGASRGILQPLLEQRPAQLVIANRTRERAEGLAADFADSGPVLGCGFDALAGRQFDLILNATAASLSGDLPPLPSGLLAADSYCYDLAYASSPTAFVRWGRSQGAALAVDGLGMLVEQAAEAFYLWRGMRPVTADIIAGLEQQRSASG